MGVDGMAQCAGSERQELHTRGTTGAEVVYLNGDFVDAAASTVSLFDAGYLLGDGVFDTMRTYERRILALSDHLERFHHSAATARIPLEFSNADLEDLLNQSVERSNLSDAYIRLTLTRGRAGTGLADGVRSRPTFSIMVRPLPDRYAAGRMKGIDSTILYLRRVPACCLDPRIKSTNYLPAILARQELEALKMLEGIQLSTQGDIVSGTVSNFFLVRENCLVTPSLECGPLPGVTRRIVLELARKLGLRAEERAIPCREIMQADEAFFTNTLMEVLPVRAIDKVKFDCVPGPITTQLCAAYRALVHSR